MKIQPIKWTLIASSYLVYCSTLASAMPHLNSSGENQKKTDALICIRELIQNRENGLNGISQAVELLTALDQLTESESEELDEILNRCEEIRRSATVLKSKFTHEDILLHLQGLTPPGGRVYNTVTDFLFPIIKCTSIGETAGAAVVVGFATGFMLSYCIASDGQQWFEASIEVFGMLGEGGLIQINFAQSEREDFSHRSILDFSLTPVLMVGAAFGANVRGDLGHDNRRMDSNLVFDSEKTAVQSLWRIKPRLSGGGFGLGEGVAGGIGISTHIQLIPLGTNPQAMLELWGSRETNQPL